MRHRLVTATLCCWREIGWKHTTNNASAHASQLASAKLNTPSSLSQARVHPTRGTLQQCWEQFSRVGDEFFLRPCFQEKEGYKDGQHCFKFSLRAFAMLHSAERAGLPEDCKKPFTGTEKSCVSCLGYASHCLINRPTGQNQNKT